jgi:GTPase SAR1 family protein
MSSLQFTPAQHLADVYRTLEPGPLISPEELNAFYSQGINAVRGGDKMQRIRLRLERAHGDSRYFKACVMGHRGVGKSTEISQLITQISHKFQPIRFSAESVLDPGSFKPVDVLLVMLMELVKQTAEPISDGGAGQQPSDLRLRELLDWFSATKVTSEFSGNSAIAIEAGAGVKEDSLWGKVLGVFANLKGEIKYASSRKTEVVEYRLTRLSDLIEVANRLLDHCNELLMATTGKQWLFIGEDFDRAGIPSAKIEDLFINYANIFQDLRSHLIFTLPIGLFYSAKANRLPFTQDCSFVIPDTPMFDQDHNASDKGRDAVKAALAARMTLALCEADALERLVVASGGNLRDLFGLINYAADGAMLRNAKQINGDDADGAIVNLRSDYERRLGQSPYDVDVISYDDKVKLLKRIYDGEKEAQMTNPILYSLLNARSIQEFNGQRWFGIHPLVVDILIGQNHLAAGGPGGTAP